MLTKKELAKIMADLFRHEPSHYSTITEVIEIIALSFEMLTQLLIYFSQKCSQHMT